MRRTVWTTPAQVDLARIDDFLVIRDMDHAEKVGRAAIAAGVFLAEFPFAGEEVPPDHRRWHVRQTHYILIYRICVDSVDILRVRHERENWQDDLP